MNSVSREIPKSLTLSPWSSSPEIEAATNSFQRPCDEELRAYGSGTEENGESEDGFRSGFQKHPLDFVAVQDSKEPAPH